MYIKMAIKDYKFIVFVAYPNEIFDFIIDAHIRTLQGIAGHELRCGRSNIER